MGREEGKKENSQLTIRASNSQFVLRRAACDASEVALNNEGRDAIADFSLRNVSNFKLEHQIN